MNRLRPRRIAGDPMCPVTTDAGEIAESFARYLADESKLSSGTLASVALPRSVAELAHIVAAHHAAGEPVTISGARTGVVGGAVAEAGGHLISVDRIKGIEEVGVDERGEPFARVRAGTTVRELYEHLANHHPEWIYPVDPTETSASLGGTVATNASGPRTFHYGPTRDWVRWIRVVLADGRILELRRDEVVAEGGRLELEPEDGGPPAVLDLAEIPLPRTKSSLGYPSRPDIDAIDLFIGSEGTLGVITDVELRLAPRPRHPLYLLQFFPDDDAALGFVEWLRGSSLDVLAIEYFDRRSLELVAEGPGHNRYEAMISDRLAAAVYTEIELGAEERLDAVYEAIGAELERLGASEDDCGAGLEESDHLEMKAFRHAVPERLNALVAQRRRHVPGLHKIATDMAVEDDRLRDIYRTYREMLGERGFDFAIFGHVGNNHFHVNILPRDEDELARAKLAYRELATEVVSGGGAVSAEHGIGRIKKEFLAIQYGPEHIDAMRRIKRFLDPELRLNPGVLFDP
jgi:D-lactate dehydrogenase (cytochrome)